MRWQATYDGLPHFASGTQTMDEHYRYPFAFGPMYGPNMQGVRKSQPLMSNGSCNFADLAEKHVCIVAYISTSVNKPRLVFRLACGMWAHVRRYAHTVAYWTFRCGKSSCAWGNEVVI